MLTFFLCYRVLGSLLTQYACLVAKIGKLKAAKGHDTGWSQGYLINRNTAREGIKSPGRVPPGMFVSLEAVI
jgi:hypothetical protein